MGGSFLIRIFPLPPGVAPWGKVAEKQLPSSLPLAFFPFFPSFCQTRVLKRTPISKAGRHSIFIAQKASWSITDRSIQRKLGVRSRVLPLSLPSFLVQSVRTGRGYFTTLREESASKKRRLQLRKLEEQQRHQFQPPEKISEIPYRDSLLT